jgi:hypothetical protein
MGIDEAGSARSYERTPAALWVIAIVCMAPFPLSSIAYGWGAPAVAAPGLNVILAWSACVLGFLGGVRWGLESGRKHPRLYRLVISVLSPMAAFGLLLARHSIPESWVIAGFIVAFLVQWLFDHQAPDVPARYPRLSTAMTAAACISLAVCLDQAIRGHGGYVNLPT